MEKETDQLGINHYAKIIKPVSLKQITEVNLSRWYLNKSDQTVLVKLTKKQLCVRHNALLSDRTASPFVVCLKFCEAAQDACSKMHPGPNEPLILYYVISMWRLEFDKRETTCVMESRGGKDNTPWILSWCQKWLKHKRHFPFTATHHWLDEPLFFNVIMFSLFKDADVE